MILNEVTIGAHELWSSLKAIFPLLVTIIILVFAVIFFLWVHKRAVWSNGFFERIDPAAAAEITLLRKQCDDKDREISAKNKRIEHLETCIQRIVEIGIKS